MFSVDFCEATRTYEYDTFLGSYLFFELHLLGDIAPKPLSGDDPVDDHKGQGSPSLS